MVSEFFQILFLSCVIGKCFNAIFCEHVKTNSFLQNLSKFLRELYEKALHKIFIKFCDAFFTWSP